MCSSDLILKHQFQAGLSINEKKRINVVKCVCVCTCAGVSFALSHNKLCVCVCLQQMEDDITCLETKASFTDVAEPLEGDVVRSRRALLLL